jgi:hypothetical protein
MTRRVVPFDLDAAYHMARATYTREKMAERLLASARPSRLRPPKGDLGQLDLFMD